MQPYFNPTRWNMEDDLNIFENGRRPQLFSKWKTTYIYFENGRRPQFFENERQPFFANRRFKKIIKI